MEKNMTLPVEAAGEKGLCLSGLLKWFGKWASEPVALLAGYYSSVLERKVSQRQTLLILEAQAAFFTGILPADIPVVVRLLAAGWFVSALMRCRKSLFPSTPSRR